MAEHAEHIVPKKVYFVVFGTLLILTALTWRIAYVDLGAWNTVVALLIAVCKASLVAAFFMHLRWSAATMRIVLLAALFWLAILITLTLSDVLTRGPAVPVAARQNSAAALHVPPSPNPRR